MRHAINVRALSGYCYIIPRMCNAIFGAGAAQLPGGNRLSVVRLSNGIQPAGILRSLLFFLLSSPFLK
jgi:hypothetical protein